MCVRFDDCGQVFNLDPASITPDLQETAGDLLATPELIATRAINTGSNGQFGMMNGSVMNDMDWEGAA